MSSTSGSPTSKRKRRVKGIPAQYRDLGEHGLTHHLADLAGGWICHYCGREVLDTCDRSIYRNEIKGGIVKREFRSLIATADHVLAVASGGTDDLANFVIACWRCNVRKGSRGVEWIEANPSWTEGLDSPEPRPSAVPSA